jgi:hypothetical protein
MSIENKSVPTKSNYEFINLEFKKNVEKFNNKKNNDSENIKKALKATSSKIEKNKSSVERSSIDAEINRALLPPYLRELYHGKRSLVESLAIAKYKKNANEAELKSIIENQIQLSFIENRFQHIDDIPTNVFSELPQLREKLEAIDSKDQIIKKDSKISSERVDDIVKYNKKFKKTTAYKERSKSVKSKTLLRAKNKCELSELFKINSHILFVEQDFHSHHIIPLTAQKKFKMSIDNVYLTLNIHSSFHYFIHKANNKLTNEQLEFKRKIVEFSWNRIKENVDKFIYKKGKFTKEDFLKMYGFSKIK